MKPNTLRLAVAACFTPLALASPYALADTTSDLKAEIEAQKAQLDAQRAQMDAQRARLEALEKKLNALTVPQAAAAPAAPAKAPAPQVAAAPSSWPTLIAGTDDPGFTFRITPQDTVTLYGLIDVTMSDISNANAAGNHKRSYQTAWFSGDRWGITGRHGISENTGIIFKLESEFDYQTGEEDTAGVLFNRDAWLGFQSDALGKLTFGRQNALARDITAIYGDPYSNARVTLEEGGYSNTNNYKQLIYYAASATGTRYDRGAVWKKEFGPLVAGVGYQFGGVAGQFQTKSTQTAALGFNGGEVFHLAGYYNHFNVAGLVHKAWSFGGNVVMGPFRLNSGYYKYNSEQGDAVGNRKDHAYTVSGKLAPPGPWDFTLGYQLIHADNAGVNAASNVLIPYADASGVTRTATGNKKTIYGAIFYHFDRRAELYLTADNMKLTDGYRLAVTNGHNTQTEVGTGLRFRF